MKTWKKALGLVLAFVCLMILSGGGSGGICHV